VAGEGSANRPGERFGGLVSDGLRLSEDSSLPFQFLNEWLWGEGSR
jgi:hypothetical protein